MATGPDNVIERAMRALGRIERTLLTLHWLSDPHCASAAMPDVLDGLMHHGTSLRIGTHYTDTGGTSGQVFILCAMFGVRFCPQLRDLPNRKPATIEPVMAD